jgi:lysozyme family protein
MTDRIQQLIARYVAVGLVYIAAKVGSSATSDSVAPVAGSIASAVVALGLLAYDLYQHRKQRAALLAPSNN